MSKHQPIIKTTIKIICLVLFCHAFYRPFWAALYGWIWSVKVVYFRHLNNIQSTKASLQNLFREIYKNGSWKSCLDNKDEESMFLLVSPLDEHQGFTHLSFFCFALLFFVCPIRCASKIARLKNRVHGIKFVHPCWNCFPPSNQRHVWNFKKKAILIQSKNFQRLSTGI